MNINLTSMILTVAVLSIGCVKTVNDRKTTAVPFVRDQIAGRYERPVSQVHQAARAVLEDNGTLSRDSSIHTGTNTVYALEGRVNQRTVWIRVEEIEPRLTAVTVQARGRAGGADIELVHELEKQIAIKLAR